MEEGSKKKGYAFAILAGLSAAFAAISAKFFSFQLVRYGLVIFFNVIMWGCYVNSLKALSSLQATVTNFATNFLSSGLAGFFLFEEALPFQLVRYGLVIFFNVIMWGCYINSLKALSSLQATVTNFATNFLSSGLAGFFLFEEALPFQWFAGALLIVIGVLVLSKSSIEEKTRTD